MLAAAHSTGSNIVLKLGKIRKAAWKNGPFSKGGGNENGPHDVKSENGMKIDTLQIYLLNVTMFLLLRHFATLYIWGF